MTRTTGAPPDPGERFSARGWRRARRIFLPDQEALWRPRNLLRLLLVAGVVALIGVLAFFRSDIVGLASEESLKKLGYVPVFVLPLISSSSIVVPLPGAAVVFLGGALLAPLPVGVVAGMGEALGELTGYAAGYGVGPVVERGRYYERVASWTRRHGAVVLFLLAVVPNPIFDVAGMTAGAVRYPLWRFLPIVMVGKVIKDVGLAMAGAWGAGGLADFLGRLLG